MSLFRQLPLCLLLLAATPVGAQQTVEALVAHWPPWLIAHDEDRQQVTDGAAVDLVREVFDRMGIQVRFSTVPWQRSLTRLEDGNGDLIPLISRTPERDGYMVFSDPLYTDELLLVTSSRPGAGKRCQWTQAGTMVGRNVGTVRDYAYGERWLEFRERRQFKVVTANDDLTNLKKVAGGRLDYTVQYYSNLKANMDDAGIDPSRLAICGRPVELIPLRVGIARTSPLAMHLDEFNRTLRGIRTDGTYARILGERVPTARRMEISSNP